MKKILAIAMTILICFSITQSSFALENKKYKAEEYMYKVSLYVGNSDTLNNTSDISNFKIFGNPIFIKGDHFTLPQNLIFGKYNKLQYQNGAKLESMDNPLVLVDYPPATIIQGGNEETINYYFGNTTTLAKIIEAVAKQENKTKEALITDMQFTINGVKKRVHPNQILPIKSNGSYQNRVPWVIVYEPITITHIDDKSLAFTATEYAMASEIGYFDYKEKGLENLMFREIPSSTCLKDTKLGCKAVVPGEKWTIDEIKTNGGWFLKYFEINNMQ